MDHVAGEINDVPKGLTGGGTTTTGEVQAGIVRDAELPVAIDHRTLVVGRVEVVVVSS